jgi:methylenetetrahydrofolate dehydrogenase (NADP+)/methenyltetrahydrofolate cyclohydrolase
MAMGERAFESATPKGIMELLKHYKIELAGKNAVVVGRSPILGKPVAMLLLNANATVTICHSQTKDLPKITSEADIVVGAVGKPEFIKASWIKKNAVVVDAGYHSQKVGDVEISAVKDKCHAYTPVPGGVGPMTICMLLVNTLAAAEQQFNLRES